MYNGSRLFEVRQNFETLVALLINTYGYYVNKKENRWKYTIKQLSNSASLNIANYSPREDDI